MSERLLNDVPIHSTIRSIDPHTWEADDLEWLYAADEYRPGPGFRRDIEYSYHISGEPAPYVPSDYLCPDYTVLGRSQMEFYYHFRDCIRNGEYPETDRGYIWLALCEILVAEEDPGRAMSMAGGMLDAYGGMFPCNIIVSTFLYDYAISHDLPLPVTRWAPGSDINEAMIGTQLSGPSFDLSMETLYSIGAYDDRNGRLDPMEYCEYLNRALEGLDSDSRHVRGYSLLEWYGNSRKEVRYTVFEDFGCVGETRTYLVDFPSPFSNESFTMYMEAVSKYCAKRLLGSNNGAPRVPSYLDQSSRDILDDVFSEMRSGRPRVPFDTERNPSTVRYRPADAHTAPRGYYTPEVQEDCGQSFDDDMFSDTPALLFNPYDRRIVPDDDCLKDIHAHLGLSSEDAVEYVPAGYDHPHPSILTRESLAYYVYWRTMCRRGTFLDTDSSYMWMYLTELVNFGEDEEATLSHLVMLSDAYGNRLNDLLATTALEYALCHNLPVPRNHVVDDDRWMLLLMHRFLNATPMEDLTLDMFLKVAEGVDGKYMPPHRDRGLLSEVLNMALRSADEYLRSVGRDGLAQTLDVKPFTVRRTLFNDLYYRGDNGTLFFNFRDVRACRGFVKMVTGIVKIVLAILRKRDKKSCPRVPADLDRGLRSHVEKTVNDMLDAKASGTYVRPTRIVLDTEAISVAREDLDVVTGLMSVPEDEEDRTVVHEEPTVCDMPSESTGWRCLAQTLDEDCMGYIEACLDGKGRMFAKSRESSVSILEGRINDTAMDLVGDIIVEDGSVIEDYVDDVKNMLSMR